MDTTPGSPRPLRPGCFSRANRETGGFSHVLISDKRILLIGFESVGDFEVIDWSQICPTFHQRWAEEGGPAPAGETVESVISRIDF